MASDMSHAGVADLIYWLAVYMYIYKLYFMHANLPKEAMKYSAISGLIFLGPVSSPPLLGLLFSECFGGLSSGVACSIMVATWVKVH